MPSFTEGTWEFNEDSLVTCHSTGWGIVALIFDTEKKEGGANARLITAAPEMYKMLRAIEHDLHCIPHRLANDISGLLCRIDGEEA